MNLRNTPCPCGSGKKYKKCCGSEAALNAKRREAEAKQLEIIRARAAEREQERAKHPGYIPYHRSSMAMMVLVGATLQCEGSNFR